MSTFRHRILHLCAAHLRSILVGTLFPFILFSLLNSMKLTTQVYSVGKERLLKNDPRSEATIV